MSKQHSKPCPSKPALSNRPLITARQAQTLESIFKMLASSTRLRMLHALACSEDLCVGELADKLNMSSQAVSNQLQRLADRRIVAAQRDGLQIRYSIIDPCVTTLLHEGWCLAEDTQPRNIIRKEQIAS